MGVAYRPADRGKAIIKSTDSHGPLEGLLRGLPNGTVDQEDFLVDL